MNRSWTLPACVLIIFCGCGGPAGTDGGTPDAGTDARAPDLGGTDLGPDTSCRDGDGDGHGALDCGGDDCDDTDPNQYPGNTEVCDAQNVDEDCNPATLGPDGDGDGAPYIGCCNTQTGGALLCGTDCDDHAATINVTAVEACNGRDDDCNGLVDDGVLATYCPELDGDAHGSLAGAAHACTVPVGASTVCNDCDDGVVSHYPGATELCNGVDDDCDGAVDEGCTCTVGMTRACGMTLGACMAGVQGCPSGTWETACTGGVFPALEVCNGIDDDCDGTTDEGTTFAFFPDCDVDGYGSDVGASVHCMAPVGVPPGCTHGVWSMTGGDCADTDPMRYPGHGCTAPADGGVDASAMDAGGADAGSVDLGTDMPLMCTPPMLDCTAAIGCETNGAVDAANCGMCGHACAWGCVASSCNDATRVFAGRRACGVRTDHTIACWGNNTTGGLGTGDTASTTIPVPIPGVADAREVAEGDGSGCALLGSGGVLCWGVASGYELGTGLATGYSGCGGACALTPQMVSSLTDATHISAGGSRACAVRAGGTVECWGTGYPGDGAVTANSVPAMVTGITDATGVACGQLHSCAVHLDGTVSCWGDGALGCLGNRMTAAQASPVAVYGLTDAVEVGTGGYYSCARRTTGGVSCWGAGVNGHLGNGATADSSMPVDVIGLSAAAVQLSVARDHACVRFGDGTVQCWGQGDSGQLGNGGTALSATPVTVSGLTNAVDIAAGDQFTCAVTTTGAMKCWGVGTALGTGGTTRSLVPIDVMPP